MANFDDQEIALAGVYAAALLNLASERKEAGDVLEELAQVVAALDSKDHPYFDSFLTSPTVDSDRRRDTLEKMFRGRASETFVDGLHILNRKSRLGLLRAIHHEYESLYRTAQGHIEAVVRSAAPLSPEHVERVRERIQKRTGKQVDFVFEVDPSLIGGLVVQVGDRKVDASISRKLEKMAEALQERAAREVLRSSEYVA